MKRLLFALFILLSIGESAWAVDRISVEDVTVSNVNEGNVTVKMVLDEGSTIKGYSFWMQVPEGLAFMVDSEGKPVYTLGNCYEETPIISAKIADGYLKVACASSKAFKETEGILIVFKLKSNGSMSIGQYTGTLVEGMVSEPNGHSYAVADGTFTINVVDPSEIVTLLDENSDNVPNSSNGLVNVRVKRTIVANTWSTICLPFSMTAEQIAIAFEGEVQLGDFDGCDVNDETGDISVKFVAATAIEANHPYIIKVSDAVEEFTVEGVDIAPEEEPLIQKNKSGRYYNSFIGNYVNGTVVPDYGLFLNDNKFWFSKGKTKMKAFRAYFDLASAGAEYEDESRIAIVFDETTGIGTFLMNHEECIKDNAIYNLKGQRVEKPGKGIYIYKGKKVKK